MSSIDLSPKYIPRLKIKYGIALVFIFLVIFLSFLLIQKTIRSGTSDSRIINTSGKQRMYSQKIAKLSMILATEGAGMDKKEALADLDNSLKHFKSAHIALQSGDDRLGIPERKISSEIKKLFTGVSGYYDNIVSAGSSILKTCGPDGINISQHKKELQRYSDVILHNDKQFLFLMNKITFQFEAESEKRIQSLKNIEYYILIIGAVIIFLEFELVFRPTVNNLGLATEKLIQKQKELVEKNNELEILSAKDKLTDLFNRIKLDYVLTNEVKRSERYKTPLSLIILDIDHFKNVNDTFGHLTGDKVLIDFANILKTSVREIDVIGRWGGEEFLIICPNTKREGAVSLAEHIRIKVSEYEFPVVQTKTASFGVASYAEGDCENDIISRADKSLYVAKERGRNMVVCSDGNSSVFSCN